MPKRQVFRLRWHAKLKQWVLMIGKALVIDIGTAPEIKSVMESRSRKYVRNIHMSTGALTQLVIHNKDGRIQQGGTGEATYGKDPRRFKG